MRSKISLLALYLVAGTAGYLFHRVGAPLPWMIGPLIVTAVLTVSGVARVTVPTSTRPFGQITVATFIGAHFTPDALHSLLETAPLLIGACLYVLAATLLVAQIQRRVYGTDNVTGFLSVVPTSPVEAGVLAEYFGVPPGPVVMAQTARIALVVTIVPFMLYFSDRSIDPPAVSRVYSLSGVLSTLGLALLGPFVFKSLRIANPYFLGPLFLAAAASSLALPMAEVPPVLLAAAQIVLGTWLGSCFRGELFERRGRLVGSMLLTSTLMLVFCAAGAVLLSWIFGRPFATMMLGMAPGGVTEMALTAGLLGQDVALVTGMHLARIFVIMPNLGWIARITRRFDSWPSESG